MQQLVVPATNYGAETFRSDAAAVLFFGQNRWLDPIIAPVSYCVGQIRAWRFDLNQIGPEKLNWIEPPFKA